MSLDGFQLAYNKLNDPQKQAVDTIDGVVMVIAGPGSGKTQLLSVRIANILQNTDADPSNILCLTFTESAAHNMRERVAQFVGQETASKIAIKTFHSFGIDTIREYKNHFGITAEFQPLTPFDQSVLLRELVLSLPFDSVFKSRTDRQGYVYLNTIQNRIGELKKAGLTPIQFSEELESTLRLCKESIPSLQQFLVSTRKATEALEMLSSVIHLLEEYTRGAGEASLVGQALYMAREGLIAMRSADKLSTSEYTKWRNEFFTQIESGVWEWSFATEAKKWKELAQLYQLYQSKLTSLGWLDFDDMLLILKERMVLDEQLRLSLQEKYQYILVDEFQDNNRVQNEILFQLGNNPVTEGNPNILVVGDDDQAIYKFGGANLTVLKEFVDHYPRAQVITLTNNYRSAPGILNLANEIIQKADDRFDPDKTIVSAGENSVLSAVIQSEVYPDSISEHYSIVQKIKECLSRGIKPSEIGVIAREHKSLTPLARLLNSEGVAYTYERSENILENKDIRYLISTIRYVTSWKDTTGDGAQDELLPEILAHPSWNIPRSDIWTLSLDAKKGSWLTAMQQHTNTDLRNIAYFFMELSDTALYASAEETLSVLVGTTEIQIGDDRKSFFAPFKSHITAITSNNSINDSFYTVLQHLKTLFNLSQEARGTDGFLTIKDFLYVVDHANDLNLPLMSTIENQSSRSGINLLTAHKAKGLEFQVVIIVDATAENWSLSKKRGGILNWPAHWQFSPEIDTVNDVLRLLYVAITRSKEYIFAFRSRKNNHTKETTPIEKFTPFETTKTELPVHTNNALEALLFPFSEHPYTITESTVLQKTVENLRLSPTSFLNFLDLTHGGPYNFLEKNILQFPSSNTTKSRFGNVMHSLLEIMLNQLKTSGNIPKFDEMQQYIRPLIKKNRIRTNEWDDQQQHAEKTLTLVYQSLVSTWKPDDIAEYNYGADGALIEGVPITGKIDRITEEGDSITVVDYKTGTPISTKTGMNKNWDEFKYRAQYLFYKTAIEQSKKFSGKQVDTGVFIFLDTTKQNSIEEYTTSSTPEQESHFRKLVEVIANRVKKLNFPTTLELDQFKNDKGEYDATSNFRFMDWLLQNS